NLLQIPSKETAAPSRAKPAEAQLRRPRARHPRTKRELRRNVVKAKMETTVEVPALATAIPEVERKDPVLAESMLAEEKEARSRRPALATQSPPMARWQEPR
ncbi:Hypothetical predicted protein, partial [Paramuricea clavata]